MKYRIQLVGKRNAKKAQDKGDEMFKGALSPKFGCF